MLMMNDVFERTWGERAGPRPADDYWPTRDPAPSGAPIPDFVFMAEAYWDLEWALQQQGFDYCYDKRLYDRLVHDGGRAGARAPHAPTSATRSGLVRFIENHDEPRAAATFPPAKARAAAVATLTQTGARLVHEGQLEGRTVRLPVFLARRPDEPADADLRAFYERLLAALARRRLPRAASGSSARRSGWDGNDDLARTSSPGAGAASPASSSSSTSATRPRPATSRCRGTTCAGARGGSTTPPRASATSAAATTCATASTSRSSRGRWHLFDLTPLDAREG